MTMQSVTLDDVAHAAGVSRATASRALTGSGPASAGVREKVRAAAADLGFTPNQAARALASNKAHAIALVIPESDSLVLGDPFIGGMITGVAEAFRDTDYQLILIIVRPDEPPDKASRLLRPSFVDGAIIVSHHLSGQLEQEIAAHAVPTVYVGRPWATDRPGVLYVDLDNIRCGALATRVLIDRGARTIACVAGPSDMAVVQDRTEGWRAALREAGLTPGPLLHAQFTVQGGATAMQRLLEDAPGIDAVFAQSDLIAAGAVRVLTQASRRVGDDVFVVGIDNSDAARTTTPRLTTMTNPPAELSLRAAKMLLRVIDEETDPALIEPEIVEPTVVRRESA